jgi:hypothetical protein
MPDLVELLRPRHSIARRRVLAEFTVEWCNTCNCEFVRCPRCGNNSCNGGFGEEGKCPVCEAAYALMQAVQKLPADRRENVIRHADAW